MSGDGVGRVLTFPGKQNVSEPEREPEVVEAEFVDDAPVKAALAVDQPQHDVIDLLPWQQPDDRRPIVHPALTKEHRGPALRWYAGRYTHKARYHVVRLPWYQSKTVAYSFRGGLRTAKAVKEWVTHAETKVIKDLAVRHATEGGSAALRDGHAIYHAAERVAAQKIRARRIALGVAVLLLTVGGLLSWFYAPWALLIAAVLLIDFLGYVGRPVDRPLIGPAVVSEQYVKLTSDMVVRALSSMGIAALSAKDAVITFPAPIQRDGEGWRAEVDLPHGTTASEVIKARSKLASGLRRPLGCVWPEGDPSVHEGRLILWVGDRDLAKNGYVRWPLAVKGRHDFFERAPFGQDPRGRPVTVPSFQHNILAGGLPGQGKTGAARVLTCADALDPTVELWLHELKGTGDLDPLECVSHRFVSGCMDEDIAYAAKSLRMLRAEVMRRAAALKLLPKDLCPDKMLTREIADKRSLRLWPLSCVIDECFPAGTMIGDLPIEAVRVGDIVPSWDEDTGRPCLGRVAGTMAKVPYALVRVVFASGVSIVCTPNHSLMTRTGWCAAGALNDTSEVLRYAKTLRPALRGVLDVRHGVPATRAQSALLASERSGVLFPGVLIGGTSLKALEVAYGCTRANATGGATSGVESDVRSSCSGQAVSDVTGDGSPTVGPGREWSWADGAAAVIGGSTWVAYGDSGEHWQEDPRGSDVLQAGYCTPAPESGYRGGWCLSRGVGEAEARRSQDGVAEWCRVDRVEILEPGSDGRYGGLCPDGFVYNFEVEGTHTYQVADGYVAHNCQNLFSHPDYGKQAGEDAEFVIRMGRALAVKLTLLTQRPDKDSLPTGVSGNVSIRFCLHVAGQIENDMILGTSSYQNGLRATILRPEIDAGIGYLKGTAPTPVVVKVAYLNQDATVRIAARARAMREKAGTLSGVAVGEAEDDRFEVASLLDDLNLVYAQCERTDRQGVWSQDLCTGLAALRADVYGGWDPDTLAAALKPFAIRTIQLHMPDESGVRRTRYGLKRELLDKALAVRAERRKLESS